MNQPQFADAAGLSLAMMGKIERGENAPSFDSVEKIAAALNMPEAALFATGTGTRTMTVPTGERDDSTQSAERQRAQLGWGRAQCEILSCRVG